MLRIIIAFVYYDKIFKVVAKFTKTAKFIVLENFPSYNIYYAFEQYSKQLPITTAIKPQFIHNLLFLMITLGYLGTSFYTMLCCSTLILHIMLMGNLIPYFAYHFGMIIF